MLNKFDRLFSQIISEGINTKSSSEQEADTEPEKLITLKYEAEFCKGEGTYKGSKTIKTEIFTNFNDLDAAIADYMGGSIDDMDAEIYSLGADVQTDMDNYGIDYDSETKWEDYFRACIKNEDTSMILVHDYNDDDGNVDKRGNKYVIFSYEKNEDAAQSSI